MSALWVADAAHVDALHPLWVARGRQVGGHAQAVVLSNPLRPLAQCRASGTPAALVGGSLTTSHASMRSRPTR